MAILNSGELARRAKPFCPTNWAKEIRDFHKHGWKLPIPRYDAGESLHVRLSELGALAESECAALIAGSRDLGSAGRRRSIPRGAPLAAPRVAAGERDGASDRIVRGENF